MNTKQQLTLAWTVAGILAILLLIAAYFLFSQPKDLSQVLDQGSHDISAKRDQIRNDCNGTDQASKDRCAQDLQDLADILREFSADISKAAPAPTASTSAR